MAEELKQKILFVSAPFSGVEVYLRNLQDAIRMRNDIRSSWIWIDRKPTEFAAYIPRLNWSVKASIIASLRIRALENSGEHFDAAFFNHLTPLTFLVRFRKRVPTVISLDATPVLLREHSAWYQLGQETYRPQWVNRMTHILTRRSYTDAALIIAWSAKVKESLVKAYGVDPMKIKIVPPGIDLSVWTKKSRGGRIERKRRQRVSVIFVGGDFLRKGGDLLLKVAGEKSFKNCDFHFVTNSFTGGMSANVFVYSSVKANSEEMLALYRNADIAVLPTHADFTPLAICEAMAMNLPVVSTNVGNIGEMVVDGKTGFLIPPGDFDSLKDSLQELVSNEGLRKQFGRNGRELAEKRFNLEKNSKEMIESLKAVSKQSRSKIA
jgi:glycosyltransferase involved in cell wall biosynthesis